MQDCFYHTVYQFGGGAMVVIHGAMYCHPLSFPAVYHLSHCRPSLYEVAVPYLSMVYHLTPHVMLLSPA